MTQLRSLGLWGGEKTGKTSFALSAPRPLVYYNFDWGFDRVKDRFIDGLDLSRPAKNVRLWSSPKKGGKGGLPVIKVYDYPRRLIGSVEERYSVSAALLHRFFDEYQVELDRMDEGTVAVDTATEVDDFVQIETLEGLRVHKYKDAKTMEDFQPVAFDYGRRNEVTRSVYLAPLACPDGVHAVFVHKAKDVYIGKDRQPGLLEMAGWKGATAEVDVMVQCVRTKAGGFSGILTVAGIAYELEGMPIPTPTFDYLAEFLA